MRPIAERAGARPARITQAGTDEATALQVHSGQAAGGAIRVLAVSDEVAEGLLADPRPVRSAQLIVACGDLPAEYLGALMNALDLPLVFVPGNHDPDQSGYRVTRSGLVTRSGFPARPPWPTGAVNADGQVVDVAGLRIAGLGGCLRYGEGPNQYTERQHGPQGPRPAPSRPLAGPAGPPPGRRPAHARAATRCGGRRRPRASGLQLLP